MIAYSDLGSIPAQWSARHGVLGPAQLVNWRIAYSAAYVAHRPETHEYTVVIRGTNMYSWLSCGTRLRGRQYAAFNPPPHAPADALVSQGTFTG